MRSGESWSVEDGGFTRRFVRPKITTLVQWVKCFTEYMQTMAVQQIQELPAMLSYLQTIVRASETNPGLSWLFYDEQFRLKLVSHPNMEWGKLDNHLWVYCITNHSINKYETETTPIPKKITTPQVQTPFQRGRGGHCRPSGRGRGRGGGDHYQAAQQAQGVQPLQ